MFGTLVAKELGQLLTDVTLGNPAHVEVLSGCHSNLPTVRHFANFDLSIIHRPDGLLDRFIGRHRISTKPDLPQIDDRTDRGFKSLIRVFSHLQCFKRHFGHFLRNRNPFAGACVHLIQRRLLVHRHHVLIANNFVFDHLTKLQDFLFTRTEHLAGNDGSHVEAHPRQLVFFLLHLSLNRLRVGCLNRAHPTAGKKESHHGNGQISLSLHNLLNSSFLTYDIHT